MSFTQSGDQRRHALNKILLGVVKAYKARL
jgi:methylaspartate ammonia-lyase